MGHRHLGRSGMLVSPVVGATRPEQLRKNVAALDRQPSADFVAAIEGTVPPATIDDPERTARPSSRR